MFRVKVQRVPGDTRSVSVHDGDTVAEAIAEAGEELRRGDVVRVNGVKVDPEEFALEDDNEGEVTILISGAIKGN